MIFSEECHLDTETLKQAQGLADEVYQTDGVELKLDWEFAEERVPGQANNFCCRAGDQLVGYALLEGDDKELEVTAAVSALFRRQGIFTSLLQAVQKEAERREAESPLLVGYRVAASGAAAAQALGLKYMLSEYRMEAEAAALPVLDSGLIHLEQAAVSDTAELAQMLGVTFERKPLAPEAIEARLRQPGSRYFFAEVSGKRIGQIGAIEGEGYLYIRGVGVLQEHRRRGYGQQMLASLLEKTRLEGHTRFLLDVATENPSALTIYKACGFRETTIYDYYDVPLAH